MRGVAHDQLAPQKRVAVVGSGLAGLTAAYLLQQDPKKRYAVTLLERGPKLSLDSASISVPPEDQSNGSVVQRIDVPMRGFTGGYYRNLFALYEHLGISFERKRFRFAFSLFRNETDRPYFIHASDNHQIPPPRPHGVGLCNYLIELLFVAICFAYFTLCCRFVPVRSEANGECETLDSYLCRIRLPRPFTCRYLLPLMSSIATCSHEELLNFPASDIVIYRKQIINGKQFVVTGGVRSVEKSLVLDIDDVRTGLRVIRIDSTSTGSRVMTQKEDGLLPGDQVTTEDFYDEVIIAVPPSVAAAIFFPAREQLQKIPIRTVQTVVHKLPSTSTCRRTNSRQDHVEDIHLRTAVSADQPGWTEATHTQYGRYAVTSCPFANPCAPSDVLASAQFTRTLRSPSSQQVVNDIFACRHWGRSDKTWKNGTGHVWMVGAWCWDGMVLLEGAVVSAMRVAEALDVEIPWQQTKDREDGNGGVEAKQKSRLLPWNWLLGKSVTSCVISCYRDRIFRDKTD